ncbi:MAG: LysR family transcriptional regulator [Gammaproteobacteria bacterium RIFCSPHIGHO2_12_FULL_38_11]|nr:MAG: LysR family transcriptional regulator [Gammaproteobacteria bacterium RIFCSPHIGHO2_12_FULL_38_11]
MSELNQMEIFYFVATWKNFSKAALDLGVSKGYVSTQITALEKSLGVKLLYRTTRHLSLTEEGVNFLESCNKIIREKQSAISFIKDSKIEPSGHLKISAPPSMCNTFLAELMPQFQKKYPKISLTVDSSSTVKNLEQHGIDIALRITSTPDENYIARVITTFRFVVCATQKYFKKHSMPKNPDDLIHHNCLIYAADPTQNRWPFQVDGKTQIITVNGNLISENNSIVKSALLADQGITRLPQYVLSNELKNESVIALFTENMSIEMPLYAIYVGGINIPAKIHWFISFLKENNHFAF